MQEEVRQNLATIVIMTVIGAGTTAFALSQVLANAGNLDVGAFSLYIIVIPCAVMLLASFAVVVVAQQIGRQLFLVIMTICLVGGIVVMVVTSGWMADPDVAARLIANSESGATVTPILKSPVIMLRDIAAFVVCPTVGCIAGAWVGSRLHPLKSTTPARRRKRK